MEKELIFALISTTIYLSGAIFYWRDILRGRTIPHPFMNLIGLILVGFNAYVLFQNGEYYSLISLFFLLISLALFGVVYGIRGIRKIHINWFDYVCLCLSIGLLIYWYYSANILNTVILSGIIDIISYLPVFKKAWLQPWTETALSYITGIAQMTFLLFAQSSSTTETTFYWITIIGVNTFISLILFFRRYYLKGWNSIFE